jgi:hypothetical protein
VQASVNAATAAENYAARRQARHEWFQAKVTALPPGVREAFSTSNGRRIVSKLGNALIEAEQAWEKVEADKTLYTMRMPR